jgi:hypothetical protein
MKLKADRTHTLVPSLVWKTHMRTPAVVAATVVSVLWLSLRVIAVKEKRAQKEMNTFNNLRFKFLGFHCGV